MLRDRYESPKIGAQETMSPQDFLILSKALDMDLVELKDFIQKTELNRKLVFFSALRQEEQIEMKNPPESTSKVEGKTKGEQDKENPIQTPRPKKGNITKLEMDMIGGENFFALEE